MTIHSSIRSWTGAVLVAAICLFAGDAWGQCPIDPNAFVPDEEFTSTFFAEGCRFSSLGGNPFFPLIPGWQVRLESDEGVVVNTVLKATRVVAGVRTRVVEEMEFEKDGSELVPVERSLNFFAVCLQTGSVFYFGEEVHFFDDEGNEIPGTGGWLAGLNGARAGIIMPGTLLTGGGYYQETAPADSALDKGRIVSIEKSCEVGSFNLEKCVEVEDTSDCSSGSDRKVFAAGIGNVVDEDLELVSKGFVKKGKGDHGEDD